MSPKNGKGATSQLAKGNIASGLKKDETTKKELTATSLKEFVKILGGLPVTVKAIAKLSGKTINAFKSVMKTMIEIMEELDKKGKRFNIKKIETTLKSMSLVVNLDESFAKVAIKGPLALLGAAFTKPVVRIYIEILELVGKKDLSKEIRKMNALTKAITPMISIVRKSVILFGLCMALGAVVFSKGGGKLVLGGLAVLAGTLVTLVGIIALTGYASKMLKSTGAIKGVKEIITLTLASFALVALCIGVGALLAKGNAGKILLLGLGVLGITFIALTAIFALTGLAAKMIKTTKAFKSVREIMLLTLASFVLVALCIGVGAAITKGGAGKILLAGLGVLAFTIVALIAIFALTGLAAKLVKTMGVLKGVRDIILLTLASMAIVVLAMRLGKLVIAHWKETLLGLSATVAVMYALIKIAQFAGKKLTTAKKGIVALAIMEAVAAGAIGVVYLATKLGEKLKDKETRKGVYIALGFVTGVLGLFGALAVLASYLSPEIIAGSAALLLVDAFAAGAIKVVSSVIDLDKKKNEIGVSWKQLGKDVLAIEAVVASFGIVAGAFSLLTIPILAAQPAIRHTSKFAKKSRGIIMDVFRMKQAMDKAGGASVLKKVVKEDLPAILDGFSKKNLDLKISVLGMKGILRKYKLVAKIAGEMGRVVAAIGKIAEIGNLVDGGKIRPVLGINKETGEMRYGDPVDVVGIAKVICDTMNTFVNNMNYGFKDLKKMIIGAAIFKILGVITTPISKFIEMVTGYVGGSDAEGNYLLTPVHVDSEGKITYGAAVDVKKTATVIVGAVSKFVEEIFSEENANKWSELVYGNRTAWQEMWGKTNTKTSSVKEIGGMLGLFVSPVAEFIECISKFQATNEGHLTLLTVDSNGKVQSGGDIDVDKISKIISGSISTFVTEVYKVPKVSNDDVEKVKNLITDVSSIAKVFGDLSEDKRIDTDKLSKKYKSFDEGSASISRVTNSIIDFDAAIGKEKNKRKKEIDEFASSIENLLNKFKGDHQGIVALSSLITNLSNMDTSKVSANVDVLNSYDPKTTNTPTPSDNNGDGSGKGGNNSSGGGKSSSVSSETIKDGVAGALNEMVLSVKNVTVNGGSENAFFKAFANATLQFSKN